MDFIHESALLEIETSLKMVSPLFSPVPSPLKAHLPVRGTFPCPSLYTVPCSIHRPLSSTLVPAVDCVILPCLQTSSWMGQWTRHIEFREREEGGEGYDSLHLPHKVPLDSLWPLTKGQHKDSEHRALYRLLCLCGPSLLPLSISTPGSHWGLLCFRPPHLHLCL